MKRKRKRLTFLDNAVFIEIMRQEPICRMVEMILGFKPGNLSTLNPEKSCYSLLRKSRFEKRRMYCFLLKLAYNINGLIKRSWSTEAQGKIPAFVLIKR